MWIVVVLIVVAIIVGALIISNANSPTSPTGQCSENFFWTGNDCCYDSDGNSVCDNEQTLFEYILDCDGIHNMKECGEMCISKCAEIGFRMAVSAVDGNLASHAYLDNEFYCNCVPD